MGLLGERLCENRSMTCCELCVDAACTLYALSQSQSSGPASIDFEVPFYAPIHPFIFYFFIICIFIPEDGIPAAFLLEAL